MIVTDKAFMQHLDLVHIILIWASGGMWLDIWHQFFAMPVALLYRLYVTLELGPVITRLNGQL